MPDPIEQVSLEELEAAERVLRIQARFSCGDTARLYLIAARYLDIDRRQMVLISRYVDQKILEMS